MSLNYSTYVAELANLMATDSTTPEFQIMLPGCIDYAEQRIYREIDLLSTVVRDDTAVLTPGDRNFTLPTTANGPFVTVQGINVITPAGSTPANGKRNALSAVARDYLDMVWNSSTGAGVPINFAMIDQNNLILGPWPSAAYTVEVIGTIIPNPLSATNTTTFLTLYLPDLFMAASMVFASGYMRDFGSQSDNPAQAASWEAQYQTLFKSANMLELRKKWAGPGWTPLSSIPIAPVR
jgi:hypothetical protein